MTVSGQTPVQLGTQTPFTADTTGATDSGYDWTTSDPAVATVDANGMVTATGTGTVMITATGHDSGVAGQFSLNVSADDIPFLEEWSNSPHNDVTSDSFRHWDDDGEISTSCAKCHSTHGFRDFLGDDGTDEGIVNNPAALGTTVECLACHNEKAFRHDSVTFPSGVMVPNSLAEEPLGRESVCMECHQGRESKDSVDAAIAAQNPPDDDSKIDVGFKNIHYFPAAATRYGGTVRGGYLYDGQEYDVLFRHVPGLERCQDCHDPHTTKVRLNVCAQCHNISTQDDLRDIRMDSSATRDYDGDGNLIEGLYFEIDGLRTKLLTAIQEYASEIVGQPIIYDAHSYPYWFYDNGQGANFPNRYQDFTARLLKATFNYQYAVKDPGGYTHNGKFIIQLLHDSINDLNTVITNKVDMSAAIRNDSGHFDGTAAAFRYFDGAGDVRSSCAKCHSASNGFDEFLIYGTNTTQPIANGFDCAVCHTTFDTFETRAIYEVEFPGGMVVEVDDSLPSDDPLVQSQICSTCHQGRTSKADIDAAIMDDPHDLGFMNVHYLAAAATLFGTDVQVGYEYDAKQVTPGYSSKFLHASNNPTNTNNCVFCHSPELTEHTFLPQDNLALCQNCHRAQDGSTLTDVHDIRLNSTEDYNGNGKFPGSPMGTETLDEEVQGLATDLYAQIQMYARTTTTGSEGQDRSTPDWIVYDSHAYPYFFKDTNMNGVVDPGEAIYPNRYTQWDGRLLRAAHNYQHSQKETGAWAHNFAYIMQLVYDSIEDLGGDVSGYIRPTP